MKIEMLPHDPAWKEAFQAESQAITQALGQNCEAIHHIGSTSIPGIYAKPIIDILVAVRDLHATDEKNAAMEALGYEAMGEFGIPGRRYFRKETPEGRRTHHVHAFASSDPGLARHLAFRDYLIAHPPLAQEYSELKRKLAAAFPDDIYGYMDGKDPFIREHERKALQWKNMP